MQYPGDMLNLEKPYIPTGNREEAEKFARNKNEKKNVR